MNEDILKPKLSQFSSESAADVFRRPWIVPGEILSGPHLTGYLDQLPENLPLTPGQRNRSPTGQGRQGLLRNHQDNRAVTLLFASLLTPQTVRSASANATVSRGQNEP